MTNARIKRQELRRKAANTDSKPEPTQDELDLASDVLDGFKDASELIADLTVLRDSSSGITSQFADGILKSVTHLKRLLAVPTPTKPVAELKAK